MTLTIGTGPFGNQSAGTFNFDTGALKPHTLYFEDSPRRVRVAFGGEIVADSKRAKLMHETGLLPIYYFPQEDVRSELLEKSDHTTHCPFKGDASYWSVKAGEHVAENAVWSYPEPLEDAPPLAGYVAFCWKKMETMLPPCSAHTHSARVAAGQLRRIIRVICGQSSQSFLPSNSSR